MKGYIDMTPGVFPIRGKQRTPFRIRKIGGRWFLFDNDLRSFGNGYIVARHIAHAETLKACIDWVQRLPTD